MEKFNVNTLNILHFKQRFHLTSFCLRIPQCHLNLDYLYILQPIFLLFHLAGKIMSPHQNSKSKVRVVFHSTDSWWKFSQRPALASSRQACMQMVFRQSDFASDFYSLKWFWISLGTGCSSTVWLIHRVLSCSIPLNEWENAMEQKLILNGLSLLWIRKWRCRLFDVRKLLTNTALKELHLFMY